MIDELKPYPAMKESGVPWLGRVPGHWNKVRSSHGVCKQSQSQKKQPAVG
jgi:hypothetical protein